MLELVVLAQNVETETASEDPATVVPHRAFAFDALRLAAGAVAGVGLQTLPSVAHPGLTKIADSTDHLHASGVLASVLDDTVPAPHHALLLAALRANWQALY